MSILVDFILEGFPAKLARLDRRSGVHQDHVALQVRLVEGRLRAEAALKVLAAVVGIDAVTQKLRHAAADATTTTTCNNKQRFRSQVLSGFAFEIEQLFWNHISLKFYV